MQWSPTQLATFAGAIRAGGVCAAPAEGVYGYVADPFNPKALEQILALKQRDPKKGFIVLIENLHQLPLLCPVLPDAAITAIQTHWQPGQPPTTLILPALPTIPQILTGTSGTVAVRLPSLPYMKQYLKAVDTPLISTSLNISGQPPAVSAEEIPAGIPALTLPQPLSGTLSRIYNPLTNTWLR